MLLSSHALDLNCFSFWDSKYFRAWTNHFEVFLRLGLSSGEQNALVINRRDLRPGLVLITRAAQAMPWLSVLQFSLMTDGSSENRYCISPGFLILSMQGLGCANHQPFQLLASTLPLHCLLASKLVWLHWASRFSSVFITQPACQSKCFEYQSSVCSWNSPKNPAKYGYSCATLPTLLKADLSLPCVQPRCWTKYLKPCQLMKEFVVVFPCGCHQWDISQNMVGPEPSWLHSEQAPHLYYHDYPHWWVVFLFMLLIWWWLNHGLLIFCPTPPEHTFSRQRTDGDAAPDFGNALSESEHCRALAQKMSSWWL